MPKNVDMKSQSDLTRKEEYKLHRQREQRLQKIIPLVLVGLAAIVLAGLLIVPNLLPKAVSSRPLAHGSFILPPERGA